VKTEKFYVDGAEKGRSWRMDTATNVADPIGRCPIASSRTGLPSDRAKRDPVWRSCAKQGMTVLIAKTGAVLATLPIGDGKTSLSSMPKRGLAFSSNREGTRLGHRRKIAGPVSCTSLP